MVTHHTFLRLHIGHTARSSTSTTTRAAIRLLFFKDYHLRVYYMLLLPPQHPEGFEATGTIFILFFVFISLINIIYSSMYMQLRRHLTHQHHHLTLTINDDGHITANTTTSIGRIFSFFFFFSCFILLISIATVPCTCNDVNDVRPINTTTLYDGHQRLQPRHSQHNHLEW